MKLLWVTWKDSYHPAAGGAEVVCDELTTRLVRDGYDVTILTSGFHGAEQEIMRSGVRILRVGTNRYAHPFQALGYYLRHLRGSYDIVIEEVNGSAPYFSVLFDTVPKRFLLYHQLARKNWLYEIRQPFGMIGYFFLAPIATRLLSLARVPVITVSESTRRELARFGLPAERTHIISEGIQTQPISRLSGIKKYAEPTLLSLGSMRAMKRTLDHIEAFEQAKQTIPSLRLLVAGDNSSAYGQRVMRRIARSQYAGDITYAGKVSRQRKLTLMRRAHIILQTAVEEGWGLTITEAASQGTPAVAYNVAGLRDSVRQNETGILTEENPGALARGITGLLGNAKLYDQLRSQAWEWSKTITFERSYHDFLNIMEQA